MTIRQLSHAMLAVFAVAILLQTGTQADPVHLIFSTDTRGLLGPCPKCPGDPLQGGLPRRATLVKSMRDKLKTTLVLDAGNSFFGGDTVVAGPKIIVDAYNQIGYDAMNIAWEDFRGGKDVTLDALRDSKVSPISANLVDASSGKLLFQPFIVKEIGGTKLAILGITEPPPLPDLPHIKKQLNGIRVEAIDTALKPAIEQAKAQAKSLVLLYHGSASGLALVQKQYGGDFAAILVGGTAPGEVPAGGNLFVGFGNGRSVVDVTLADGKATSSTVDVASSLKPDPALQKLVDDYTAKVDQLVQIEVAPEPKSQAKPVITPAIEKLEPNVRQQVNLANRNAAAELRITSVALLDQFGASPAPSGFRWLALGTTWTNLQPARLIDGKFVPVQYLVQKLSDNLYIVANNSRVLEPADVDAGALLGKGSLLIANQGESVSGTLLYAVPKEPLPTTLSLRFYDFAHGNIVLPILGAIDTTAEKPAAGPVRNEVVELGAFNVKKVDSFQGRKAPSGMTFLQVDLRGRSTVTLEADASGFTPGAKKGKKIKIGSVADWKDSRQYLAVIADDIYAYSPLEGSPFREEPRFLPDILTGDNVVFQIPAASKSLHLRCDFPNAAIPGAAQPVRPKGLEINLEGRPPSFSRGKPIVAMQDEPFKITITDVQCPPAFAGQSPPEDKRFLVLQVLVENVGKNGEFFQTKKQLQYATASGETLEFDPVTASGLHPSGENLWIPATDKRVFEIAFAVPTGETKPRLSFTGATSAKIYDLPALAAMTEAPVAQVAPEETKPADTSASQATAPPRTTETKPAETTPSQATSAKPATETKPTTTDTPAVVTNPVAATGPSSPSLDIVRPRRSPKGIAGVGLTGQQVNAAIDKGSKALWLHVKPEFGIKEDEPDPLVGLALVHAEAHKKYPDFNAALRKYLTSVEPRSIGTYQAGLLAMLIESYGDPTFLPKFRETVRYLLEAQGPKGSWTYNVRFPDEIYAAPTQKDVMEVSGGAPLDAQGSAADTFKRMTEWSEGKDGDNSVSQFALLGLNAASRSGLKLPPETWKRMLAITLKRQCKEGGWSYESPGGAYGSMTCAGICATAICRHELGEKEPADHPAIASGITWLAQNFSVTKNPEKQNWVYYYLYSLERVGRILDTEFIGENEWYPVGALRLVSTQPATGLWVGDGEESDPRLATSFALLFLTRATPTLKIQPKRGGDGMLMTSITSAPVMRMFVIMDCSGSMLEEMQGKTKLEHSQDAVVSLIEHLLEGTEFGLRAYGHRRRAIEPGADEDTELVIPMGKLERAEAIATVRGLRARGRTPMAQSIEESVGDLKGGDKPITVILLTDGGEDTQPRRDPVKACALLGAMSNVRFNIVGFDINQEDWSESLRAMAAAGHARYWPAAESQALMRQIQAAVFGIPDQFVVKDAKGNVVYQGRFGESHKLPEGKYLLRAEFGNQAFEKEFWINAGVTTAVGFDATRAPTDAKVQPQVQEPVQPANPSGKSPRFCTGCGKSLQQGDKFCGNCGAKVE